MCLIVALVVGLAIDTGESTENALFCHRLDIAVDGCTTDFWLLFFYLSKDIVRREMPTGAGITDDIAVLVRSHRHIVRKSLKKASLSQECI